MDFQKYLGENVEIVLFRKRKYKTHFGRIITIRGNKLELRYCNYDGVMRSKWVSKPQRSKDSIKKIKMEMKK